jgi:8-oxo-dGTP diphosphatase
MQPQSRHCYDYPRPALTTDVVIFTLREQRLQLLLIRRRNDPHAGMWALPGGFLDMTEDIERCAQRELEEETGVSGVYLEQLYTFGRPDRDPRGRVISVAYYALVPEQRLPEPQAASDAAEVGWFPVDALPPLAFDHAGIIAMAHQRLVAKLEYSTIALQLMPEHFTLSELQHVYEAVLGEPLDKRNFRKRILALGHIEETGRLRRTGRHRPAREYRIRHPQRVEYHK